MEELREKLHELILEFGTKNKEVIKTSEKLDNYIINYYKDNLTANNRQPM